MSDVAKMALVFRAAAEGIVAQYHGDWGPDASADEVAQSKRLTMQRVATSLPAVAGMYFAYDGIASIFEKVVEAHAPAAGINEMAVESEVLGYLVVGDNYNWSTTVKQTAQRQAAVVPNGRVIELVARPGAAHGS